MTSTITLSNGDVATVDDDDYDVLSKYRWHIRYSANTKYAMRNTIGKMVAMHREIMGCPVGMEIDHINWDGLDNRKQNLRVVTKRQNAQHRKNKIHSVYPGVSRKRGNRWVALVRIGTKTRYITTSKNEVDAAVAYRVACKYLFGTDIP